MYSPGGFYFRRHKFSYQVKCRSPGSFFPIVRMNRGFCLIKTSFCSHSNHPGMTRSVFYTDSFSAHSASLNPVSTVSPSTSSGRFISIPFVASSFNCSSSFIVGSLSFNCISLYSIPLVLKLLQRQTACLIPLL